MAWWRIVWRALVGTLLLAGLFLVVARLSPRNPAGTVDGGALEVRGRAPVVAADARASVVAVEAQTCQGPMAGTGFVIDGDLLITNRHLVDGAGFLFAGREEGQLAAAIRVDRVGAGADLALGRLSTAPALPLASADPAVGTGVVLIGRSADGYRWLEGNVHLHVDGAAYGIAGPVMLIDPATTFGYSGGPVVNGRGEVVGVLQAVDRATDLSLAIPISTVHEWLEMDVDSGPSTSCIG